jgi:colanic acid/amylovoran biosynthesis glycosyltransferase
MALGYFFSTFPALSTTFLQREVRALENQGVRLSLFANRPPLQNGYHPHDQDLKERTVYLNPIDVRRYGRANIDCLTASPKRYFRALKTALRLKDDFARQRLRNTARLAGAAVLGDLLAERRIRHLHVHFAFGAAGVSILLKELTGIPYSLSIHGSDVLLPQPLQAEKLKRAAFIVSNCLFHVDNLKKRFPALQNQKFHVVRLGLDLTSPFWSNYTAVTSERPLKILNIGRLLPVKAQEILIHACACLKRRNLNFICQIAGGGPRRLALETLIVELGLSDYVRLLGPQYEAEIVKLIEWSHVMVLSSKSEGTPMTVIEAMAKARPAIAPDITALPEMIEDGRTGFLFQPESAESLADKLSVFCRNPDMVRDFGQAARRRAESLYDIEKNTVELKNIFLSENVIDPACRKGACP